MARAKRDTRSAGVAGIAGIGVAVAAALLWACSSSSSSAPVLGDDYGSDSGEITVDGTTVVDSGKPSEAGPTGCKLVEAGCLSLENCGSKVNVTHVAQAPPVAAGGTVVPGTYVMTDYTIYTGAGGATGGAGAWVIETQYLSLLSDDGGSPAEGGPPEGDDAASEASTDDAATPAEAGPAAQVFQLLDVSETDTNPATTLTGTSTFASPTRATIVYGCPSSAPTFASVYTATPTTFQLFVTVAAGGEGVITYTKM
jgi:hypothetical protein